MNTLPQKTKTPFILAFLALVTLAVYWPVQHFPFVNYDDDEYVYENPHVQSGLTPKNILWAFGTTSAANWHPVTWLSLMLDRDLYGLDPGGYHLTNLSLHIFNTLLLFIVLLSLTKAPWRSAFVSCLFALHPLHVESVAWVSERKDLLCTFFMLLSLWTYSHYVDRRRPLTYARTLAYFTLGLMAKPMLVTLPFVFLLLDFWPLRRFHPNAFTNKTESAAQCILHTNRFLFLEKVPFFVLTIASCCLTLYAQKASGAVADVSLDQRIANATISYVQYILQTVWPVHLSFFYPWSPHRNLIAVAIAILVLGGMTFVAIKTMRRIPWLFVGWFWYLGTLFPVIGIIQVGSQSMADRYTYIPLTGIFFIFIWGVSSLHEGKFLGKAIFLSGFACILAAFSFAARKQVGYWLDSATLFRHALAVTSFNCVAHNNLGKVFFIQGKPDSALFQFSEALKIFPNYSTALYNTGFILQQQGKPAEALPFLQKAVLSDQNYTHAHQRLGETYEQLGNDSAAIVHFRKAIATRNDFFPARYRLAMSMLKRNHLDTAIACFDSVLARWPACWEAHYFLGLAFMRKNIMDSAFSHLSKAMRLHPLSWELSNDFGEELFKQGRINSALHLYSRAIRLAPDSAKPYLNRAIAFTIKNKLDSAVADYQHAIRLKPAYAEVHFCLAQVFDRLEKHDSARIHMKEAERINLLNSENGKTAEEYFQPGR